MISGLPTLLDLVKMNQGVGFNLVQEAVTGMRPELAFIPADTMVGTEMVLTVCTTLPTVAFRHHNEGVAASLGKYTTKIFQTSILDQIIGVDKRIADKALNRGQFLENMSMPLIEAALDHICNQFWYGIGNDAKGFPGLIAQAATAATHVKDAGETVNVATCTSAWFIETGREKIGWLWGNQTSMYMDPAWKDETLYDTNGNPYPGLTNWIHGSPGLRLANKNKVVRIKNISDDTDHDLNDTTLFAALKLCTDLGMSPTDIFMNGRAGEQWRSSRTATNATGAPAPLPRDFEGIPVHYTPHIVNTEVAA